MKTMAECTVETVCTNCIHINVCKSKEKFLKLVQMVNETQFKYSADVDKPIRVECREWQAQTKTPRSGNAISLNAMGFSDYYADYDVLR